MELLAMYIYTYTSQIIKPLTSPEQTLMRKHNEHSTRNIRKVNLEGTLSKTRKNEIVTLLAKLREDILSNMITAVPIHGEGLVRVYTYVRTGVRKLLNRLSSSR